MSVLEPEIAGADTRSRAADTGMRAAAEWTPSEIVLRDAWFPVAHVETVKARPIRRLVHSQPYYVWRDRDRMRASERHPQAALINHAFSAFSQDGEYPLVERYGYAWVWYGDPAAADASLIPDVPFLPPGGGLPAYTRGTVRFDCSSHLSLENLIDLTHADFLHANVVGDEISEEDGIEVLSTSETVTMIRTSAGKSVAPVMRWVGGVRAKFQDVRAVIHVHLRNGVALAYGRYRPGFDVPLFHPCVPESRDRCRLPFTFNTTKAPGLFRYVMPQSSYIISRQDNSMVKPQAPLYAQLAGRADLHSRFDGADTRYRFQVTKLAERQAAGDFTYLPDGDPGRDVSELLGITREH